LQSPDRLRLIDALAVTRSDGLGDCRTSRALGARSCAASAHDRLWHIAAYGQRGAMSAPGGRRHAGAGV